MTTATYDPVAHMTTLDCPYGCGAKLVADETYVGNATCLNDSPRYYSDRGDLDECEGYAISYDNSDEVCYAVQNRLYSEERRLAEQYDIKHDVLQRIAQSEKAIARLTRLANRISEQHG